MAETDKPIRLSKAAREFNVGISTIVEFLGKKGVTIVASPNTKLTPDMYVMLEEKFQGQKSVKEEAKKIGLDYSDHHTISIDDNIHLRPDLDQDDDFDEVFIKDTSISKSEIKAEQKEPVPAETKPEPKPVVIEETEPKAEKEKPQVEDKVEEPSEKVIAEEEKTEVVPEPEEKVEKAAEPEVVAETVEEEHDGLTPRVLGKIDLDNMNMKTKPDRKSAAEKKKSVKKRESNVRLEGNEKRK